MGGIAGGLSEQLTIAPEMEPQLNTRMDEIENDSEVAMQPLYFARIRKEIFLPASEYPADGIDRALADLRRWFNRPVRVVGRSHGGGRLALS